MTNWINTTLGQNILQIVFGVILNGACLTFTISAFVKFFKTRSTKDWSITFVVVSLLIYILCVPTGLGIFFNVKQQYENGSVYDNGNVPPTEWVQLSFLLINAIIMAFRVALYTLFLVNKLKYDKLESPRNFLKNIKPWILITTSVLCAVVMGISLYYSIKSLNDPSWKWVLYCNMIIGVISVPQFFPQALSTIETRKTYGLPLIGFLAEFFATTADMGNCFIVGSASGNWSTWVSEILADAVALIALVIIVVIKIKNKDHLRDKNGNFIRK